LKSIAIIPARGGSKRLPRKNIIDFRGKPIIHWTIRAAFETGMFSRIVVSTEDDEIARVALYSGAEVDKRSHSLARDNSTVDQVCLDLLDKELEAGRQYDLICCLYATAPLRSAEDIINTMHLVTSNECEHAMAVTNYNHPAFQAMFADKNYELKPLCPDLINKRSSDLEEIVVDNGSTYVSTVSSFRRAGGFVMKNIRGYKMPRTRSVDIDYEDDLKTALHYAESLKIGEGKL
jgi:pseudaminic acid cytidylyltransferase